MGSNFKPPKIVEVAYAGDAIAIFSPTPKEPDTIALYVDDQGPPIALEYRGSTPDLIRPGAWTLLDPADPSRGTHPAGELRYHMLVLSLRHHPEYRAIFERDTGRVMGPHVLLNRLVSNYVVTLSAAGDLCDGSPSDAVARNLRELVALALRPADDLCERANGGLSSATWLSIVQCLEERFCEVGLVPAEVAAHCGIASRYLHKLFEQRGLSFSEHLVERRLQHAAKLLTSPSHRHRTILEIALECGFANEQHFARRYR